MLSEVAAPGRLLESPRVREAGRGAGEGGGGRGTACIETAKGLRLRNVIVASWTGGAREKALYQMAMRYV